jgi:hypothetical protein
MNSRDQCGMRGGGGLVPAQGCTCKWNKHTRIPAIRTVCMGSGGPVACPTGR